MLLGSYKAADLHRDPRVLVHSVVAGRDGGPGEFKMRGRAIEALEGPVQEGYARQVRDRIGWDPVPGQFHLFRIEVDDVTFIRYDEATGDQYVTCWPSRREFVRRSTTATSLGDPEPYHELLVDR
jgi:hypothetical protein